MGYFIRSHHKNDKLIFYNYVSHKLLGNSSYYFSSFPWNRCGSNNQNLTNVHMNHPGPFPMGE